MSESRFGRLGLSLSDWLQKFLFALFSSELSSWGEGHIQPAEWSCQKNSIFLYKYGLEEFCTTLILFLRHFSNLDPIVFRALSWSLTVVVVIIAPFRNLFFAD